MCGRPILTDPRRVGSVGNDDPSPIEEVDEAGEDGQGMLF